MEIIIKKRISLYELGFESILSPVLKSKIEYDEQYSFITLWNDMNNGYFPIPLILISENNTSNKNEKVKNLIDYIIMNND